MTNRLLAALPATSRNQLMPKLSTVALNIQELLVNAGDPNISVYFPLSGWVSAVIPLADGRSAEVGLTGFEGLVGSFGNGSPVDQLVQRTGEALSMSRASFDQELEENEPLRKLVARYQAALYAQTALTVGCNGWHPLEQRLARWLLCALDRSDTEDLPLTQEFLSMMLCVHRPSVTRIAGTLQEAGIINYNRGHIIIRDRQALEDTACECYQTMRSQMAHVVQSSP